MKEEEFERFKEDYMAFFRNRYKNHKSSRKELKRSIYDNKNLTEKQKEEFWKLVIGG